MAAEIKSGHLTPPLNPYSPQEIAAFQKLDLALRSHPELAREGATLLNPKALARLIQGIKFFQDTHLGRQPTSKYYKTKKWPLLKLPDEFFRNRDGDGPLFQLFVSAYMYKKEASWRQFDFQSKNRYTDNMALLKKINMDLLAEGLLKLPAVYLDDSIPKENVAEYKSILKKFGARVVKDAGGKGENAPTHIVVWDSEEHDSTDILEQEEAAGDLVEKLYLKTLTVVDPSKAKKSTGIIETTMQDSKKKGGKVKHGKGTAQVVFDHPMAFVHWWYHPSSYDEWMPAADVAGADTDVPPRPEGGPWIIGCKFIRDVAKFNEWGSEGDYAVSD
jgi:SWI/SNF related-matrix-associated actin-dependent regulator of chromatin subfamily C